jgi:hypothetical protein
MDDASVDVDVRENRESGRYEVSWRDTAATVDYRPECRLVRTRARPAIAR